MGIEKKPKPSITARVLVLTFLVILATYATLYTVAAYDIAKYAWTPGDGTAYWTVQGTLGSPTFFPFPRGPQGVGLLGVFSDRMNPVDEFIYLYLIKTGILIVVCISLWILVAAYFFKAILPFFRQKPSEKPPNEST